MADGIAAAHEAEATVEIGEGYPVTANDPDHTSAAIDVAHEVVGADRTVVLANPIMGAEDFSYVLQKVPGTMLFLGGTPDGTNPRTAPANHSTKVFFEEDAMVQGIALYTALALRHLGMAS